MNNEYNLDFFEAMAALRQGKIVEVSYDKRPMYLVNHTLTYINSSYTVYLTQTDFVAKWRIVEPEKCWLDQWLHKVDWTSRKEDCRYCQSYAAKSFAHEAIRRIAERLNRKMGYDDMRCLGYQDSVLILKDMIGEK